MLIYGIVRSWRRNKEKFKLKVVRLVERDEAAWLQF